MNYKRIYERLYDIGYHDKGKNHGVKYVKPICREFAFSTLLEVGCANGITTHKFHKRNKIAYGIDISSIAVRYATEQFGVRNVIEGNILDIPFKDNFFDAVFSCDVLEHLEPDDIKPAIMEILRVANHFIFAKISPSIEGNKEFLNKAKVQFRGEFKKVKNLHLSVFPIKEWVKKFEEHRKIRYYKTICRDLLVFRITK